MLSSLRQNKEYVCRGHDYERLEAFQQRMLSEFPQAVAMQHPNHPDDTILQCDAQCIFPRGGEGGGAPRGEARSQLPLCPAVGLAD